MRRVRDRHLPQPFATWIVPGKPLPRGVTLLPRSIRVGRDAVRLLFGGGTTAVMGVVMLFVTAKTTDWRYDLNPLLPVPFLSIVLFGTPVWAAYRLRHSVASRRERKAGALRRGVFVGREGVLVRLVPDRGYPIPMERFVRAVVWSSGSDGRRDVVRIETRDGPVEFAAELLDADAHEVNRAVAAVRPSGTVPPE